MWLISQVRSWWTFLEWQQNDWKNNCCPLLLNTSGVAVLCVFPKGVTWLLVFRYLFGEVVGGMACFFRVSCQTLRFIIWCKAWDVLFRTCSMMISTQFRFFWRRVLPSGVDFPCPSSEGDSCCGVCCPTLGTEIRVKFIGWSWWNESVCDATLFASACSICLCQRRLFFHLAKVCMKLGAAQLCYLLCFAIWLKFIIVRPRVTEDIHSRNCMTHVLWKAGCDQLAWVIFVSQHPRVIVRLIS